MTTSKALAATLLAAALVFACSDKSVDAPPTVDLTGYFVLPDTGFDKFFRDSAVWAQTYVGDTIVNGFAVVSVLRGQNLHEYFRRSDRAWVGSLADTDLILLEPPLAAIPERMSLGVDVVASAVTPADPSPVPVRRTSRLVDTGLEVTVPAGTFSRTVIIRQIFQHAGPLGSTVTDSAYRWYARGVDEVRRVQWRDGDTVETLIEFIGGTVGGEAYPAPR